MPKSPLAIFVALLLGAVLPARATTLVALDEPGLMRQSPVVALVETLSLKFRRSGGRLYTEALVRVARPVKGAREGEELLVMVPGGRDGEWAQVVHGAPVLAEGEKSLVFLAPTMGRHFQFTGLEQGRLPVRADPSVRGGWVVERRVTARRTGPVSPELLRIEPLADVLDRLTAMGGR